MSSPKDFTLQCPIPIRDYPTVTLAHGGGGKLMHQLLEKMVLPAFDAPLAEPRHDGAVFRVEAPRMAFTTDSYVVRPIFFPGGDIGSLAINGTVNDLAMCGARPLYLSCAMILEEGLPMETLWRVVQSLKANAERAGVQLVTGDTKVVDRGKGDGVYLNTAGVGLIEHDLVIAPASVRAGDAVIVSGDVGRHGVAILQQREGLEFESAIESDCAPVAAAVRRLIDDGLHVHCLRDLTRGGLATTVIEIAESSRLHVELDESSIPVETAVQTVCELLGFDPLYLANEGRFVCFLPAAEAERALELLRGEECARGAAIIGRVDAAPQGLTTLRSRIGAGRVLDMLSGDQLPRIC